MGIESSSTPRRETATLGGGCFWCTEAVFKMLKGVDNVESGYSGGSLPNPTYDDVSTGTTGHAEVVQLTFDPEVISYREILEIFFTTHDPTTLNRQGSDAGTQYRSVIFYHNEEQKATAEALTEQLTKEKVWNAPIVTQIQPFKAFYKAENYHKDYYEKHRSQPYCQIVIAPKIEKLRKSFLAKLRIQ